MHHCESNNIGRFEKEKIALSQKMQAGKN